MSFFFLITEHQKRQKFCGGYGSSKEIWQQNASPGVDTMKIYSIMHYKLTNRVALGSLMATKTSSVSRYRLS
ncbi:MAG TPA: hypothetical protein VFJ05_00490 [Nitrososphaeraceae archaeon]|nr:hypothetical protein [Nitrososphaeraceae archaeon]